MERGIERKIEGKNSRVRAGSTLDYSYWVIRGASALGRSARRCSFVASNTEVLFFGLLPNQTFFIEYREETD